MDNFEHISPIIQMIYIQVDLFLRQTLQGAAQAKLLLLHSMGELSDLLIKSSFIYESNKVFLEVV